MKRILILCALASLAFTLPGIDEHIRAMKTTKEDVQSIICNNIGFASLGYPVACSSIPMENRAALVRGVGEFIRQYTKSAAFLTWYTEYRTDREPRKPDLTPSMAESRKKQVADIKTSIAEQEKAQAKAPADQKGLYRDILTSLRTMLKQVEATDTGQDAQMDAFIKESNAQALREYGERMAEYNRLYPEKDPRPLLKRRLQEFLDGTKGVDFDAKLIRKGEHQVFARQDYENKDHLWKAAFRAGKAPTEAARAIASQWLKEL